MAYDPGYGGHYGGHYGGGQPMQQPPTDYHLSGHPMAHQNYAPENYHNYHAPPTDYPPAGYSGAYDGRGNFGQGPPGYAAASSNPTDDYNSNSGLPGPERMNRTTTSMNLVFFAASCCVMFGALCSGIAFISDFEVLDFLRMSYLFIFGGVLAVLDTPFFKTLKMVGDFKMYINKYVNVLTRVTGKGAIFLWVGAQLFSSMWDSMQNGFLKFLTVVLCLPPVLVGLAATIIGAMKSQKLNKARQQLEVAGTFEQRYAQWAQTHGGPQGGLTPYEFDRMTTENGGFKWEEADLKLIWNALLSHPVWRSSSSNASQSSSLVESPKLPKEDLQSWISGGMVWL